MRFTFFLTGLLYAGLLWGQRAAAPFQLQLQVGYQVVQHDFVRQYLLHQKEGLMFDYHADCGQLGLAGSYQLSPNWGLRAMLAYNGFRPQKYTFSQLYEFVDEYKIVNFYEEKSFSNWGLSLAATATIVKIGRSHWPLQLEAGGVFRYLPVARYLFRPTIFGEIQSIETGEIDRSIGAFTVYYGDEQDTTISTLRRFTPGIHIGLSLQELWHDRLSIYLAVDKDLLPYRAGKIDYLFPFPHPDAKHRYLENTFFLETLSFGAGYRIW